ncbi:MAG: zinc-binding dehydrogenase, partial [Planctomycetales bacterium]|nr:zinc-binding dehydrogenase [Planctomycetales bacterium]
VARGDYGGQQDPPIILSSDMAGVVSEVGPGVTDLQVGDRVLNAPLKQWPAGPLNRSWSKTFVGGQGVDGVLAERITYPAASLLKIPPHLDFEEGCTFTVAGLTAWAAVVTHGRARPGEWVLVHGTGGVSLFALQLAKLLGARVIVSTSSRDKARRLEEEQGVAHTIDYRDEDWPQTVRRITAGRGVDVVVETAGGATLARSIQACGYGARVAVIGVLDGLQADVNVFQIVMHQVQLRGIYMESAAELACLLRAVETARLRPVIDRVFDFGAAPQALAHLQSGQHLGKVVIRCDE